MPVSCWSKTGVSSLLSVISAISNFVTLLNTHFSSAVLVMRHLDVDNRHALESKLSNGLSMASAYTTMRYTNRQPLPLPSFSGFIWVWLDSQSRSYGASSVCNCRHVEQRQRKRTNYWSYWIDEMTKCWISSVNVFILVLRRVLLKIYSDLTWLPAASEVRTIATSIIAIYTPDWLCKLGNFSKNSAEIFRQFVLKHSKKCPQYHLIGYVRLKNSSIMEKVIMVNGPEVWT